MGQGRCERRSVVFVKSKQKSFFRGRGLVGGGVGLVGEQGGCEQRIEVFVKIQKKNYYFLVGGGSGRWGRLGSGWFGQVDGNVEFFRGVSGQGGGVVGLRGVRVDENEELKFLRKFKKIGRRIGVRGVRGRVGGSGWM